jgi:hypothetical protein
MALGLLAPCLASAQEGSSAMEQDPMANAVPSGTVEIEGKMLKLIVGGGSGKGVLHYNGQDYPFTAKGLTAGGVGYTEVKATGNVYFLNTIEDFSGAYAAIGMGGTLGKGKGGSRFKNTKGVFMVLEQETKGLGVGLGIGGFEVTLGE